MLELGLYPEGALEQNVVSAYWDHLSSHVEWASEHVQHHGHAHQPLYLWGDDAQYNEENEKIVCVALGATLDERTSSVATVWPLFVYRVEAWMQLLAWDVGDDRLHCSNFSSAEFYTCKFC